MTQSTPTFELPMSQGANWDTTINWYGGPTFRAAIEEIDPSYPTILRVTGHLLPSVSETPVIISGVVGAEILNTTDKGLEKALRIDDDTFSLPISTRACEWDNSTGEITYHRPTDITNYTARCQLRSKWYSGTIIHEFTTENAGIELTAEDGSVYLKVTAAETAALNFTKAYGDIELISDLGVVTRIARLVVTFSREMTR